MIAQHFLDALPSGTLLVDEQFTVIALNSRMEFFTGYSLAEAQGVFVDYILRPSIPVGEKLARKVLESGNAICCEGTIVNKRREKLSVSFTLSKVADWGAGCPGILLTLDELSSAKESAERGGFASSLIGHSPEMQDTFERMAILARTDASVLITGETGCGKDCVAEELHRASARAKQAFIKINCGALPESLLESELFGHTKGAFTGAAKERPGMFRLADRGTLFLTEIGDLSLSLQVKLLSVLDDRSFYPIGSSVKVSVDVRIITATHRNLREEVREGRFREDLFYRLNVLHLHVPPLRQRQGDAQLLLEYFLKKTTKMITGGAQRFSDEALAVLLHYPWPGNVRELRNVVEYAVHMCRTSVIGKADLPKYIYAPVEHCTEVGRSLCTPVPHIACDSWSDIEKQQILQALHRTGGRRKKAADLLGWGRTTLWRKIKAYNIE